MQDQIASRAVLFCGYIRVSRVGDRGDKLISPELQEKRIRGYAEARGIEVEVLPAELDVSGGKVDRPILSQAIEGIEAGTYAGIIVAQLDRLSRMSIVDAHRVIERIESIGGEVVPVAEDFDTTTPEGRMGRNMFLAMAEMQRERYSSQLAAAKERAVRIGIWPLPVVPIGYRRGTDRHLEPDPATAPTVVRAFELRAQGESWEHIGKRLGRGLSGARKVIANRVYLGEIRYGEFVNVAAHEPLVERGLFEAAQISQPAPARGRHGPALLSGLLRCTGCSGLLTPTTNRKWSGYRCMSMRALGKCESPALIAKSIVEPYLTQVLFDSVGDVQVIERKRTAAIDEAARKLEVAEAELEAFQEATRVADVGAEHFATGMKRRADDVESARRRLGEVSAGQKIERIFTLNTAWDELDVQGRRHVLRGSFGVVWVRKGRGPAPARVKVMADVPDGLPAPGRSAFPIAPVSWDDLEGAIEPRPHDLSEGAAGTAA